MAGAYPGFRSMKQLRVLLLPPGRDASPSQGYPPAVCRRYPFKHLGGERQCGAKLKYIVQGNNTMAGTGVDPPTFRSEVQRTNHYTTAPP